jgi:hypothetical protein
MAGGWDVRADLHDADRRKERSVLCPGDGRLNRKINDLRQNRIPFSGCGFAFFARVAGKICIFRVKNKKYRVFMKEMNDFACIFPEVR